MCHLSWRVVELLLFIHMHFALFVSWLGWFLLVHNEIEIQLYNQSPISKSISTDRQAFTLFNSSSVNLVPDL